MSQERDLSGAKSYALRLIKFRPRSEKEVRDKLKEKSFDPAVIDQTVIVLKNSKLIDDALFARLWVEGRIKRPLGLGRLRLELRRKGVAEDVIEETLSRVSAGYDEATVIREIVGRKSAQCKGVSPDKARARLFGYLIRRGFSHERVMEEVMNREDSL
jgi:regulatory protein